MKIDAADTYSRICPHDVYVLMTEGEKQLHRDRLVTHITYTRGLVPRGLLAHTSLTSGVRLRG